MASSSPLYIACGTWKNSELSPLSPMQTLLHCPQVILNTPLWSAFSLFSDGSLLTLFTIVRFVAYSYIDVQFCEVLDHIISMSFPTYGTASENFNSIVFCLPFLADIFPMTLPTSSGWYPLALAICFTTQISFFLFPLFFRIVAIVFHGCYFVLQVVVPQILQPIPLLFTIHVRCRQLIVLLPFSIVNFMSSCIAFVSFRNKLTCLPVLDHTIRISST